jgi:hypothetical protein
MTALLGATVLPLVMSVYSLWLILRILGHPDGRFDARLTLALCIDLIAISVFTYLIISP